MAEFGPPGQRKPGVRPGAATKPGAPGAEAKTHAKSSQAQAGPHGAGASNAGAGKTAPGQTTTGKPVPGKAGSAAATPGAKAAAQKPAAGATQPAAKAAAQRGGKAAQPAAGAKPADQEPAPQDESSRRRAEAAHQKALNAEREKARKEGHKEGLEAGKKEGYEQGLKQAQEQAQAELQARATEVLQPLRSLALQFSEALSKLDDVLVNELVELALATGRHLAGETLDNHPEQVLDLVRALLHSEPVLHGRPRLWMNPTDFELVREAMGQELSAAGWALQPDSQLDRGGCRLTSDHGELDASTETRWNTVCQQVRRRSTGEKSAEAVELLNAAGFEATERELAQLASNAGADAGASAAGAGQNRV
jgi:flagellar assembly protein FliH